MLFFSLRIITSNTSHAEYPFLRVYTKDRKYQAIFNHRIEYKNESNQILKERIATNTPYHYLLTHHAEYDWDFEACLWLKPFQDEAFGDKEFDKISPSLLALKHTEVAPNGSYQNVHHLLTIRKALQSCLSYNSDFPLVYAFFNFTIYPYKDHLAKQLAIKIVSKDQAYIGIFNQPYAPFSLPSEAIYQETYLENPYPYLLSQSAQYDWDVEACSWLQPFITNSYDKEALKSITQYWSIRTVGLMGSSHYRRVTNLLELLESGENSKSMP